MKTAGVGDCAEASPAMKRRFGRPLPRVSQVPSSRTITFQPRSSSPGDVPVSSSSADRILPGTCSSIVEPSIRGGMNVFSAASGSSRIVRPGSATASYRISRLIPRYGPNDSTGASGSRSTTSTRNGDPRSSGTSNGRSNSKVQRAEVSSSTISARAEMRSGASALVPAPAPMPGHGPGSPTGSAAASTNGESRRIRAATPGVARRISSPARPGGTGRCAAPG